MLTHIGELRKKLRLSFSLIFAKGQTEVEEDRGVFYRKRTHQKHIMNVVLDLLERNKLD